MARRRRTEPTVAAPPANDATPRDTTPPGAKRMWLAGLEGPRGLACLCVILVHVAVHYTPGILNATRLDFLGQALTFFFVLSGFLLYLPFIKRLESGSSAPDTAKYFVSRVRRVFPGYLFIFVISNFVLQASYLVSPVTVGWADGDEGTGMITNPLNLLAQFTLTQSLFPSTLQTGLNPAWSLTTEWGFYLVLPVIGFATFALRGRIQLSAYRLALIGPAVLLVIGVVTNYIVSLLQAAHPEYSPLEAYWGPNWIAVLSRSFLALADNFAIGMVAAVVFVALGRGAAATWSTARIQWLLAASMFGFTFASLAAFVLNPRFLPTIFSVAAASLLLLIIAPLARGERSWIAVATDWRPLRYVGTISLSMYLWHYPVMILAERFHLPVQNSPIGLVWGLVAVSLITLVLASATFHFVEKPAMNWRA